MRTQTPRSPRLPFTFKQGRRSGIINRYMMTPSKNQPAPALAKPELLAPAGTIAAGLTAFDCGADAIYAGLPRFNARERGDNCTADEMSRLIAYAHKNGRKVYVTLNTLLKDDEVGLNSLSCGQGGGSVDDAAGVPALETEGEAQHLAQHRLVIDHQESHHAAVGPPQSRPASRGGQHHVIIRLLAV